LRQAAMMLRRFFKESGVSMAFLFGRLRLEAQDESGAASGGPQSFAVVPALVH
jgi:hypothetical protein